MKSLANKKIIIVSNTAWSLWNFRLPLAKRLQELGATVILVSPDDAYSKNSTGKGLTRFVTWHFFLNF